jgi:protein phosphatase
MKFYSLSDKGKVRPNNEDYVEGFQLRWSGPLGNQEVMTALVLADGMGGAAAGEFASVLAVRTVRNRLFTGILNRPPEEVLNTDLKGFLANSFEEANNAIFHKAKEDPELEGMGTTIVTTVIYRDQMTVGHVGDSRGYLFRNGRLSQITRDHSLVQELLDEGKITHDQALTHPNRNIITKALGVDPQVVPDTDRMPILPDDIVFLCSDGLSGFADEGGVKKAFKDLGTAPNVDLPALADRLLQLAMFGGGGDNISIALYLHQP